jgi:hypothetical protein
MAYPKNNPKMEFNALMFRRMQRGMLILMLFHILVQLGKTTHSQLLKLVRKLDLPIKPITLRTLVDNLEKQEYITIEQVGNIKIISPTIKALEIHASNLRDWELTHKISSLLEMNKEKLLKQ